MSCAFLCYEDFSPKSKAQRFLIFSCIILVFNLSSMIHWKLIRGLRRRFKTIFASSFIIALVLLRKTSWCSWNGLESCRKSIDFMYECVTTPTFSFVSFVHVWSYVRSWYRTLGIFLESFLHLMALFSLAFLSTRTLCDTSLTLPAQSHPPVVSASLPADWFPFRCEPRLNHSLHAVPFLIE